MISAPERGGRRYWRTGEKYLPSDTGQGECGEQRPPWEIYTSFKKNQCRTKDEYYNSFFFFFFPYGEILQGQGVCVTMKRGKARERTVAWRNWLCCWYVTPRPHTRMHVRKNHPYDPFSLSVWCIVFREALWAAHTVLCAELDTPARQHLSLPHFGPESRCRVAHLHRGTWGCLN